jgi:AraC-like DNA-binding protein
MQKRPNNKPNINPDTNGNNINITPGNNLELVYAPYEFNEKFPVSNVSQDNYVPDTEPIIYLHYHNDLEIGYCYEGSGIFVVNNKILPFSKGDASIIFPDEIHIAKSDPNNLSRWSFVNLDPVQLLLKNNTEDALLISEMLNGSPDFTNIVKNSEHPVLVQIIHEIIEELKTKNSLYQSIVRSLIWFLMIKLSRVILPNKDENKFRYNRLKLISPAINYITLNYNTDIKIDELAKLCNMSITNFRRTFKEVMKIPPSEYIYQFRIRMASLLLLGKGNSVLDVSIYVGYNSLSSFNRHFRRIMGVSPREWKKDKLF